MQVGGGVVGHVDKGHGVGGRDILGSGGGWCGWEEVALRLGKFVTVLVNIFIVGGKGGGMGVG